MGIDAGEERVHVRARRVALLQRGDEHERLEGRSRLALALGGQVELVLVVVLPAHHRLDLPVTRVDGDERAVRIALLPEVVLDRAPRRSAACFVSRVV